ncbi:MAG: hypothetical protein KC492_42285, partial [Myxococcales bacterium]|nr:hypothetical protein [Myxococcales bacterium]
RGRTVTDEQGRQWGFHTQQGLTQPPNAFFYCVDDDDEPYRANLPPGTYTLNYREGMQLDAEEAWDYLAGGEERRAQGSDGRLWRVLNGLAEFCGHSVRAWVTNIDAGLEAAPYTIAPDEPAMLRCSECVEQQLPSPCPKCKLPEPAETEAVTAHHQGPSTPWCEGRADGLSETADKLRASSAMCAMAADEMTSAAGYMLVLAAERDRLKDAAKRDDPDARTTATEAALANLPPNPQRDSWVRGEMAIGLDEREAEERDRIREAGEAFERRVEAHGMGKLQALGALADALPVDVEAERAISKLAAAKRADREVRPIERSCCREARERVKRQRRELRRL